MTVLIVVVTTDYQNGRGVPLNMADVHNIYTRDAIYKNKDIENINFGILDMAGNFDNMGDANNMAPNLGQRKLTALFSISQTCIKMDKCNSTLHTYI